MTEDGTETQLTLAQPRRKAGMAGRGAVFVEAGIAQTVQERVRPLPEHLTHSPEEAARSPLVSPVGKGSVHLSVGPGAAIGHL